MKAIINFIERAFYYYDNYGYKYLIKDYTFCEKILIWIFAILAMFFILTVSGVLIVTAPIWGLPYIFVKYRRTEE